MSLDDLTMPFTEHLAELRKRLLYILVSVAVGFFVAFQFKDLILAIFAEPVMGALKARGIGELQAIKVTETIMVYLKVSLIASVIVSAPFILYQLWRFVAPGLFAKERRIVIPVLFMSVFFFAGGVAFSYYVVIPFITGFLVDLTLSQPGATVALTVENTYSFCLNFLWIFGVVFELPLLIVTVVGLNLIKLERLVKFYRYFVVLSFVIAALFTPPDPFSQVLMAVPLIALYGVGIALGFLIGVRRGTETLTKRVALRALGVVGLFVGGVGLYWYTMGGQTGADVWARAFEGQSATVFVSSDDAAGLASLDPALELEDAWWAQKVVLDAPTSLPVVFAVEEGSLWWAGVGPCSAWGIDDAAGWCGVDGIVGFSLASDDITSLGGALPAPPDLPPEAVVGAFDVGTGILTITLEYATAHDAALVVQGWQLTELMGSVVCLTKAVATVSQAAGGADVGPSPTGGLASACESINDGGRVAAVTRKGAEVIVTTTPGPELLSP